MGSGKDEWAEWAEPLGAELARRGYHLLTGGGGGVMTSVSRSFKNAATGDCGLVISVVPTDYMDDGQYAVKGGYPNSFTDLTIVSPLGTFTGESESQISRNHINILTSHVVVALPGAKGTRNEVAIALAMRKPVILFGPISAFSEFPLDCERADDIHVLLRFIEAHAQN